MIFRLNVTIVIIFGEMYGSRTYFAGIDRKRRRSEVLIEEGFEKESALWLQISRNMLAVCDDIGAFWISVTDSLHRTPGWDEERQNCPRARRK